jgi:hypothetical protein
MGMSCISRNQGAYNQQTPSKNGEFTDNNGAQSISGSVNAKGLNNAQDVRFEASSAIRATNAGIQQRGFGS